MKAILVIDVPKEDIGRMISSLETTTDENRCMGILKPLPEIPSICTKSDNGWYQISDFSKGWKSCIDAIIGDTDMALKEIEKW